MEETDGTRHLGRMAMIHEARGLQSYWKGPATHNKTVTKDYKLPSDGTKNFSHDGLRFVPTNVLFCASRQSLNWGITLRYHKEGNSGRDKSIRNIGSQNIAL